MKTILTPIDFSPVTDAVVDAATDLARALNGRVVLLTVVQPPVVMSDYAAARTAEEVTAPSEKNAARQLAKIEQKLKIAFVSVESIRAVGPAVPLIVAQAERCNADYIVMGSHGHTAFYDLLVGSTTHGVVQRAKCPVVIVPAVEQKTAPTPKLERHAAAV